MAKGKVNLADREIVADVVDPPTASERVLSLGLQVGRSQAYRHVQLAARERELATLQEIKESRAYREEGYTWAKFCAQVIGRPQQSVDDDIAAYSALGAELFGIAQQVGLGRDAMRTLRALPDEQLPRLLPSGEIVINDRRIPVDAEHQDAITDAVRELIAQLQRERNRVEDAEGAATELQSEISERDAEIEALRGKVNERKVVEKAHAARELNAMEVQRGLFAVAGDLAQLVSRVEVERPPHEEILKIARVFTTLNARLLSFGAQRRQIEIDTPELDAAALDDVLRQMTEAEAAEMEAES